MFTTEVHRGTPPDGLEAKELLVRRFFLDEVGESTPGVWIHIWRKGTSEVWVDTGGNTVPLGRIEGWMHVPELV